ncbi:hypothetical protein SKAU_G00109190 [Synaphobranchus kaupii]|uniref:Sulfotransferase n=1 Tax=Synaphobranchus kaupii TaxID=118154 RepID=A0A9Q1J860_SYNKA|nr:hypothetical protein SKAU_G00109190 [Synaphobranchus kaupii]
MANPDQTETAAPPRPELFDFHGVSMTHHFTDNWDNVQNFQAKPDDILIATYPKAGTTWVSHMLDLLYFGKSSPKRGDSLPICERVPFLEINNPVFAPARNAKDNVVSYFHFARMSNAQPEPGDWPSFLQRFQEGKMPWGSWYDHVKGWWEKKQAYPKLLYLHYEDLAEDMDREMDRVCSFLGLCPTEEERHQVKERVQFDAMKKNSMVNYSTFSLMDFKISPFMRKGKVGDWKNHFTVYQNEQFDKEYQKKMMNTTVRFLAEI